MKNIGGPNIDTDYGYWKNIAIQDRLRTPLMGEFKANDC
jgi:hypothetical protein